MYISKMVDHPLAGDLPFIFVNLRDIVASEQKCPYAAFAA
jgi:hypothetical protein